MAIVTPATLKTYFETGDTPTQAQFADLIDSSANPDLPALLAGVYGLPFDQVITDLEFVLTANMLFYFPFYLPRPILLTDIVAKCSTLAAASTTRLGLYSWNAATWAAATLLKDFGTITTTSAAQTEINVTPDIAVDAGWYAAAALSDGVPGLRCVLHNSGGHGTWAAPSAGGSFSHIRAYTVSGQAAQVAGLSGTVQAYNGTSSTSNQPGVLMPFMMKYSLT